MNKGANMYQDIKNYLNQRGESDLLSSCVERIFDRKDKGIALYCGSNYINNLHLVNIIEEGIIDGILKNFSMVSLESSEGLSPYVIVCQ